MKTPFHRLFAPVVSETRIEGAPVALDADTPDLAPATEVGEQTEMLTRLRHRNPTAEAPAAAGPRVPADRTTPGGNGHVLQRLLFLGALLLAASRLSAGFASTETFLPAVGRISGQGGAQFYTTVWASNLTTAPQTLTFQLLKQGQANPSPASFQDRLQAGETKVYENVVESKLGLTNAIGAARVTSSGEIFVSERIYNQAPGDDVGNTEGLFFAGVPKSFSISAGQSASIQGVDQGGSENFRYNFALIETGGGSPTVNVQVFDGSGAMLGQRAYPLQPHEQIQPNVADVVASIHTTNARITATVTGGTGSVLLAGAQLANESQDSSGFEMTFRDSLLGTSGGTAGVTSLNGLTGSISLIAGTNIKLTNQGNGIKIDSTGSGGSSGVTSLNALTGALTLTPGNGISITPSGGSIAIAFTGGGSGGLTSVAHDASLTGAGTGASPLGIANGQVVRSLTVGSSTLHDAVTLAAGSNVTITPSGSTFTIAASGGGGGGLTLPLAETTSSSIPAFSITNTGSGIGIQGTTSGSGGTIAGVSGTCPNNALCAGVQGTGQTGLAAHGTATGLYAETTAANSVALYAINDASSGYIAHFENGPGVDRVTINTNGNLVANSTMDVGILGRVGNGSGLGTGGATIGVWGDGVAGTGFGVYGSGDFGVWGHGTAGYGVLAQSDSGYGLYAISGSGVAAYIAGDGEYSGSWTKSSDARYKTDVRPLEDALERTLMLRGVTFDWRRDEFPERHFRAGRDVGFIAQEVETVYPELVVTDRDGYKSVDYSRLTPILVEAIKAQQRKIDAQQRKIDEQQIQIDAMSKALKASSILNPDGSINLETAHRLGRDQRESWKRVEAGRKD